ncbi:dual-domain HisK/Mak2 protein kinase [Leucogyrophana mollusca]|uniref:Dual-domain HisK/Mak2 protein kinase n=1 Tax=Leucogyrophana mollusca TaxID=85980 RepID=A0ACB8BWZ6_9AGAM|nr:dual-domain HisK/Mak2 protein kinase [Leucogyrophana mollusca]
MRRRNNVPSTQSFKDGLLSVPGYTFQKAAPWEDTGSMTLLAEGSSHKDGAKVLAKIASAHSNASVLLEREALILGKVLESSEALSTTLRMIDFFTVSRANGDCVVLLLVHPGLNLLGRYFPPSKVNDFLLADITRPTPPPSFDDMYMMEEELDSLQMECFDVMDLATFLEFAIQATHCLEMIHKLGFIHREVRANAFHLNAHYGVVRFVHFGNRAVSLEETGGPSTLVIRAMDETEQTKVKEALCYLAPEQTGGIEIVKQDHRTDLYSLGMMLWTLLVGQGMLPFEGRPLELLHAIVQKRPMPVHEIRRDVPEVLGGIIDKLLAKNPDARYQSAYGLKADLLECQRRLLATVSSVSEQPPELIPSFEIAAHDRYSTFTIPIALFGRDKELETIRNVIRHTTTNFSRHLSARKGILPLSSSGSQGTGDAGGDEGAQSDSASSQSVSTQGGPPSNDGSPKLPTLRLSSVPELGSPMSVSPSGAPSDGLRRVALKNKTNLVRAHAIMITGPPGVGKSSLVVSNQAKWRSHGIWGQAKFERSSSAPFSALLGCLSSVLRQLMVFHTDLHRLVKALKERLGPQLDNLPLLFEGSPELRDILELFGIKIDVPKDRLATVELRARFQSLVENVFSVLAEIRLVALFIDDLHEADDSSLDLVEALINSRSRMLIFATMRSDDSEFMDRVRSMCSNRSRATWINVEQLNHSAIASLVSKTMRRPKDECTMLSRFIYTASSGNAFLARSMLMTFQRQNYITFDWSRNIWRYDMAAIESGFGSQNTIMDPTDQSFLISQFRELSDDAKKYLIWASFFGATFKVTEVALLIDWEDSSGSSSDDENDNLWNLSKAVSMLKNRSLSASRHSMRGLEAAIAEGWLVQRARDMCSFTHNRYRQAVQLEAQGLSGSMISKMSFRIILMMLHDNFPDVHRIAEHAKRCLPLLREHPKREELLDVLVDAGNSAWARGAHELALHAFLSAKSLLSPDAWEKNSRRSSLIFSRLAALFTWKGDLDGSAKLIDECLARAELPEEQASVLRLRSTNQWMRNNYSEALDDTLRALRVLGVEVNAAPSKEDADKMLDQVKNQILSIGFDEILNIPRATDPKTDLAVALLNDAGTNAYWSSGEGFMDVIGLTTIQLALRSGMSPGTSLGFFWALVAAAERRELYRFAADLGRLALRIAYIYGGSMEKCRANVLFVAMVASFDNAHIRVNLQRLDDALKYGHSSGERGYTGFASIHYIITRLYVCDHLSELVLAAEECVSDVDVWTPGGDANNCARAVLNCIRALGGYTNAESIETVFDSDNFVESEYLRQIQKNAGNLDLSLNWYNAFKLVGLFCTGFVEAAAELGFSVYDGRLCHPNHRHSRYAAFFHSLALIASLRTGNLSSEDRSRYLKQVDLNQAFVRKWLSPSPVNTGAWVALVDAELASLLGNPEALKLYDVAVKLALNHDWHLEEGWGLFLQGCHFVRCGVEALGTELQRRGVSRQLQWGAQGIAQHMMSVISPQSRRPLKRSIFRADVAVQTDTVHTDLTGHPALSSGSPSAEQPTEEEEISSLTASDLSSILKWSKDISSGISLSSALQRLTEIATETSRSQNSCLVITSQTGDFSVATLLRPPELCHVFEDSRPIQTLDDPLQRAIIRYALNSKQRLYYEDAFTDARFSSEANQTPYRSVICLPVSSNRGQTFGALYVSSKYAFSQNTVTILTLLCQQASISIASALLFRSVQAGTRENLKMIASQREALEAARKSREDALKATRIKSRFLASMSHELRTPFSSFYGLLDLLSGTELNPGQSEIVQTAKQSCELLLKIIDSILDYSKLEASAVKLEYSNFPVENIIADCMELLLPMAARKLDLSFDIEKDVPSWITSDYARIRQVLMNLIGNAVKFTAEGSVTVVCSVDKMATPSPKEVHLKFTIQDTGIGLPPGAADLLFVPFQQADNSSTRRFGGTGLGLSISRQLVKLLGGVIGANSDVNVGSIFWFTIPVAVDNGEESKKALSDMQRLSTILKTPRAVRILASSKSTATSSLLKTMLDGFDVITVNSPEETAAYLAGISSDSPELDFVILDDQSEHHADELVQYLTSLRKDALKNTKVVHLYTPTTDTLSRHTGPAMFNSNTPGVTKMTKPPRKARLLQTLASLKDHPDSFIPPPPTDVAKAMEDISAAQRTLFGNVLIAEDNPVAQSLLVKQLERYDLNVTATSNGLEAIKAWESQKPGHYVLALFDHHMPVCDGVEAAKRLRVLESSRVDPFTLPIVALSADCQESTKKLCLSAGMNAFFSKPLKRSDLISLLSMFGPPAAST